MTDYSKMTQQLIEMQPTKEFFVGIDSDGCVFDSMEIKHKECFCPNTIRVWGLQPISKYAREAVEFVNLYSKWRGANRWPALIKVFELLAERPEVIRRSAKIPNGDDIRAFIASGLPLSDSGLKTYMKDHSSPELDQALEWTTRVNDTVHEIVHGLTPFPFVKESLDAIHPQADALCVSATPTAALTREWSAGGVKHLVRMICGQEIGTKELILRNGASGKYGNDKILMIGDAPGDMKAARAIGALFFPINPGHEEESWEEFLKTGYERFFDGTFKGPYEDGLIQKFSAYLPELPPWKQRN